MAGPIRPLVTISLVTFNGMRWLPACMASVLSQELADFELLVLDNASTDGSVEWLRQQEADEPRTNLTESTQNLGFAAAHNRHIENAQGDFVLVLNQDVELDAAFLREAVAAFEGRPEVAVVQGRLRSLGPNGERTQILDSTGLEMRRDRRVLSRDQGETEAPQHLVAGPVWGADGPAPVYRRVAILAARVPSTGGGWEVFDEDFFMYKEDVDLAWRLHRLGWRAFYAPSALAWHARSAGAGAARSMLEIARANRTMPSWIKALSWRNQRLMQLKNERAGDYLRDLPWIMRRELLSVAEMIFADPGRLTAVPALVRALPAALRKRHYLEGLYQGRGRPSLLGVDPTDVVDA